MVVRVTSRTRRPPGRTCSPRVIPIVRISIFEFRFSWFLAAWRADVDILAQRNFQRFEDILIVEAEALAVCDVAHVGAEFSVGPEKIADRSEQLLDVIV